jgi:hypothetical protein
LTPDVYIPGAVEALRHSPVRMISAFTSWHTNEYSTSMIIHAASYLTCLKVMQTDIQTTKQEDSYTQYDHCPTNHPRADSLLGFIGFHSLIEAFKHSVFLLEALIKAAIMVYYDTPPTRSSIAFQRKTSFLSSIPTRLPEFSPSMAWMLPANNALGLDISM